MARPPSARKGRSGSTTITVQVEIEASVAEVWHDLASVGDAALCSPHLARSYLSSAQQRGVGATRVVEFAPSGPWGRGAAALEQVQAWEEGRRLRLGVAATAGGCFRGLRDVWTEFALDAAAAVPDPPRRRRGRGPAGPPRTRLTATLGYAPADFAAALADRAALGGALRRRRLARYLAAVAAGHKLRAETGLPANAPGAAPDLAAVRTLPPPPPPGASAEGEGGAAAAWGGVWARRGRWWAGGGAHVAADPERAASGMEMVRVATAASSMVAL